MSVSSGKLTQHRCSPRQSRIAALLNACDADSVLRRAVVAVVLGALALAACGSRSSLLCGELPASTTPEPSGDPLPPTMPSADPTSPSLPNGGSAASAGSGGQPMMPPSTTKPPKPPQDRCESVSVTIDELRPTVSLLVDRSGSMRAGYPTEESEQSRWGVVRQALLDEKTGVVRSLERSMQFALVFYTSHNGTAGGGTCPILSEVRAATGNYEAIRALYDSSWPDDDTPTGAAIAQLVSEIDQAKRQGPEVILLVTDGDPDTCDVPDPQTEAGQLEAVTAAASAHAANIDFYVLGISSDISGEKLQQLANAGQGKPLDARFGVDADAAEPYQASSDVAGLTEQLRGILARVPLCEVALDRDIGEDELASGRVTLDGRKLVLDADDGWRLSDPRHLLVTGKACDALRARGKRLTVQISCD